MPETLTLIEIATRLGVTRQAGSAVLNGRAGVSAEMAVRLSKALGTSADLWLGLQMQYDLWQVMKKPMPRVQRLAALEAAWRVINGSVWQKQLTLAPYR